MNILFEEFPKTVRVNGERFLVETDFREWIRFIQLIDDAKVPWQIKCRLLLQWYIDGIPDDLETAVYALGDFLAMKTENAEEDESITGSAPKQLYSFEQDAECIYSAFREVYGINLQTIPYMHWWEFQTLFAGLPEKTEIKQRSVPDLIRNPVRLGVSGFIYLRHSESTNCCAFEKLSAFRCANPGAHSIFAVTLPFASAEVNTLPRGVVIRNSFFCAIYSPSILQCGNPPNRLSDQDNTLQCLNRTSFRSADLSIS